MPQNDWIDIAKYCPCPVCGYDEISFGPPVSTGGFFQIDAVYCAMCGTVFEVAHWSKRGGTRFAKLEVVDDTQQGLGPHDDCELCGPAEEDW